MACVKYASVCISRGSTRPGGGTHTAAGLPGVDSGSGLSRPSHVPGCGYDIHCESPGVPDPPPPPGFSAMPTHEERARCVKPIHWSCVSFFCFFGWRLRL